MIGRIRRNRSRARRFAGWGVLVAALAILVGLGATRSLYVLEDTELGWVSGGNDAGLPVTTPGLHVKWPWQSLHRFDRHLQWRDIHTGEHLTRDGIRVNLSAVAVWRVTPEGLPRRTRLAQGDAALAGDLATVISENLREEVSRRSLAELLPPDSLAQSRPTGADQWLTAVQARCNSRLSQEYGLELLDISVTQLTLPESQQAQLRQSQQTRRAESNQALAAHRRQEALALAARLRADAGQQARRIREQARTEAQTLRQQTEVEAKRILAAAQPEDIALRVLLKGADALRDAMDADTTLVLEGGAEFFKSLGIPPGGQATPSGPGAGL